MKRVHLVLTVFVFCLSVLSSPMVAQDRSNWIPEPLHSWQAWVLWDHRDQASPTPYNSHAERINFWASKLSMETTKSGSDWQVELNVYSESWVPLPGDENVWPESVTVNDQPIAVLERDGRPAIQLAPRPGLIKGKFLWQETPEKLSIPKSIGILALTMDGESVERPNWDDEGFVWLKRIQANEDAKDQLTVQAHRVLEDGLPMWLRTYIETRVTGRIESRWRVPARVAAGCGRDQHYDG
jgi:hypothetical protein